VTNDDEIIAAALEAAVLPWCDLSARLLAQVERLTERVEQHARQHAQLAEQVARLEVDALERLHRP